MPRPWPLPRSRSLLPVHGNDAHEIRSERSPRSKPCGADQRRLRVTPCRSAHPSGASAILREADEAGSRADIVGAKVGLFQGSGHAPRLPRTAGRSHERTIVGPRRVIAKQGDSGQRANARYSPGGVTYTSYALTDAAKPLSGIAPSAKVSAASAAAARTSSLTRIWPSRACAQSREARLATLPIAA